ncbi:J-type co-chaperone JAC1, mitochondrial [Cytospora mali]|uniref:J-type co-chaperone JAC1, mitochondrial n=1 Tax=Cytospora mali TaxID=578113 RepID=A0A194VP76_CYTMA|nr:J-type co-chaperone JAC1, mitochondrial [Valsa mali]
MRRTLVNRELAGVCASCAQRRLAPATATASRSFALASRTYSTGASLAAPRRAGTASSSSITPPRPAPQRRWLSGSSALRSQGTTTTKKVGEKEEEETRTKTDYKPLPYYALFPQTLPDGAPPDGPFDIDVRALRREFLQLQAASHPDYHHSAQTTTTTTTTTTTEDPSTPSKTTSSSKSHSEPRRKAEALSSHINSAYKTLSSPLLRAQYILAERYGIDLAGDEASRISGPPDPELLTEVLYARETIEDAGSEKDLEGLTAENDARIEEAVSRLGRALEEGDIAGAVVETVRLRYWENIRESVRNWEGGGSVVLQH